MYAVISCPDKCTSNVLKYWSNDGYTTVDAFMQVYRATKKVKDSYEKKLATWQIYIEFWITICLKKEKEVLKGTKE